MLENFTNSEYRFYMYRHIRLDKNEPFYIGIGSSEKTANTENRKYRRALATENRNDIWKRITAKTEHKVQIMLESDSYEFIKEKEIEFIELYGQISNNTGTLANITQGGEGNLGVKFTQERKDKIRKGNLKHGIPVYQYDQDGNLIKHWEHIGEATKSIGKQLSKYRLDSHIKTINCYWTTSERSKDWFIQYKNYKKQVRKKEVYQYSIEGDFIQKWTSMKEASIKTNSPNVSGSLKRYGGFSNNFLWSYEYITKENILNIRKEYLKTFKYKKVITVLTLKEGVYRYNLDLKNSSFYTKQELVENDFNLKKITRSVCERQKSYLNSIWSKKELEPDILLEKIKNIEDRKIVILQKDLHENVINIWTSVRDVAKFIGVSEPTARKAIKNNKPYKDFYWSFQNT